MIDRYWLTGFRDGLLRRKHDWTQNRAWFDGWLTAGCVYVIGALILIQLSIIGIGIVIWEAVT